MSKDIGQSPKMVEVWLREQSDHGVYEAQQNVLSHLNEFTATERIQGFTVNTWGKSVRVPTDSPAGEPTTSPATFEKVTEFEDWAYQNGYTLQPGFTHREVSSMFTGTEYTKITLPIICLACYEGEVLQSVHPHSDADIINTVTDCLTALDERFSDKEESASTVSDKPRTPEKERVD